MKPHTWSADGGTASGMLALPQTPGPWPGILICHAWRGVGPVERDRAQRLADRGIAALCGDVYGGKTASDNAAASALMQPLAADRGGALRRRLAAGVAALAAVPGVDARRLGALGFCFGGLCALDLARAGADLRGVASFHGLLTGFDFGATPRAAVLALHGWDDPMAKPDAAVAFGAEMTRLDVDWQLVAYGHTKHAFTNPEAADPASGLEYQPAADRRSWASAMAFFDEVLAG